LEQLSADLPEQQEDFLSPSLLSFEEQLAADLPAQQEDLPSLAPDFASFEHDDFEELQDAAFSVEVVPPNATSFVEPSAAVFVSAT
jgi:hypothetical protein